jgi:hypothetical protein
MQLVSIVRYERGAAVAETTEKFESVFVLLFHEYVLLASFTAFEELAVSVIGWYLY